jgi:EAL domain-containing protein (putative c-di-GMP-specific phosphodiesterase class I)
MLSPFEDEMSMHSAIGKVSHSAGAHAIGDAQAGAGALTVESLGWELRAALPPLRLHSVSVYDAQGNVLWLSEGALGPDEHALVLEALESFAGENHGAGGGQRLEDGRTAAFLPVRAPQGFLVGLVMVLAEFKLAGEGLLNRISTAPVRAAAQKLATLLHPAGSRTEQDPTHMMLSLADDEPAAAPAEPGDGSFHNANRMLAPTAVDEILGGGEMTLELESPDASPVPAAQSPTDSPPADSRPVERATAAPTPELVPARSAPVPAATASEAALVILEVLPFVKLRAGGRMRRFEVLPRGTARQNRDPASLDVLAVDRLLWWLTAHRGAWTQEPTGFTLNLSIATLEDERFLRHLAAQLGKSGISADALGFEIAEPLCTQRRAQVERFIGGCERLGCFVVIDGFSFDSTVVPLLRSKAVRLVKIDSRLTASVLKDKLSQALVVAIVQAVKVLGIHCAAQQVDTQLALRWLTAVGCDFAQGQILARPLPIERLEQPGID